MIKVYNNPVSLTQIGMLNGDLRERIVRYNPNFIGIPSPIHDFEKYLLFMPEKPTLLMISKSPFNEISGIESNLVLTLSSYSDARNQEVVKEFQERTNIRLERAPDKLSEQLRGVGGLLPLLEIDSEGTMRELLQPY